MTYTQKIILLAVGFIALPLGAQPLAPVAESLAKGTASAGASGVSGVSKGMLAAIEAANLLKVNLHPEITFPFAPYNFTVAPKNLSPEEKALWEKSKPAEQQLALAVVLYDQNAILNNLLKEQGGKGFEKAEFQAKQKALKKAAREMQTTLSINTSIALNSRFPRDVRGWDKLLAKIDSGLSTLTIQRFFNGVAQPVFPVMTKGEMQTFAALPSLATQQAYIEDSMALCKEQMQRIINKDILAISDEEFTTYYLQKARLDYFEQVQKALADATEKRTSLILREPVALEEGMPAMTDAQRIGYLQYQKDFFAKHIIQVSADKDVLRENLAQNVKLQEQDWNLRQEISHFQELYGPYARAEVFAFPYEQSFHIGPTSFYLLPEKDAAYMLSLEGQALKAEIQKRLAGVERQLAQKQMQIPLNTAFYADYYRLSTLKDMYETQLRYALY